MTKISNTKTKIKKFETNSPNKLNTKERRTILGERTRKESLLKFRERDRIKKQKINLNKTRTELVRNRMLYSKSK